jgi:hypothetical protein
MSRSFTSASTASASASVRSASFTVRPQRCRKAQGPRRQNHQKVSTRGERGPRKGHRQNLEQHREPPHSEERSREEHSGCQRPERPEQEAGAECLRGGKIQACPEGEGDSGQVRHGAIGIGGGVRKGDKVNNIKNLEPERVLLSLD